MTGATLQARARFANSYGAVIQTWRLFLLNQDIKQAILRDEILVLLLSETLISNIRHTSVAIVDETSF